MASPVNNLYLFFSCTENWYPIFIVKARGCFSQNLLWIQNSLWALKSTLLQWSESLLQSGKCSYGEAAHSSISTTVPWTVLSPYQNTMLKISNLLLTLLALHTYVCLPCFKELASQGAWVAQSVKSSSFDLSVRLQFRSWSHGPWVWAPLWAVC